MIINYKRAIVMVLWLIHIAGHGLGLKLGLGLLHWFRSVFRSLSLSICIIEESESEWGSDSGSANVNEP